MASVFKQNDTWPPLRGRAADEAGVALELTTADSLRVILKSGTTVIAGVAEVLDPPESGLANGVATDFNWRYLWDADDLDVAGTYQVELEVTWDESSTPPKIETVPNGGYGEITVVADLD